MSVKKLLADFLASLPDDDESIDTKPNTGAPEKENGDGGKSESEPVSDKKTDDTAEAKGEEKKDVTAPENTSIDAPPEKKDITILNSDDMVKESLDMRLAELYTKQKENEDTIKLLIGEVKILKEHFAKIEGAIDTAANTSPTVASIEHLVNML